LSAFIGPDLRKLQRRSYEFLSSGPDSGVLGTTIFITTYARKHNNYWLRTFLSDLWKSDQSLWL